MTAKILVFLEGGRLWEVIEHGGLTVLLLPDSTIHLHNPNKQTDKPVFITDISVDVKCVHKA